MPKASLTRGICAVCQHDSDCTYLRNFDHPPLQCEQFEMSAPTPKSASTRAIDELERMLAIPSARDSVLRSAGLCASCLRRTTCTYSKSEGGVWHCDEYK